MVACNPSSDRINPLPQIPSPPTSGPNPPVPESEISPGKKLKWGGLKCQKKGNCGNPVLNLEGPEILRFFNRRFELQGQLSGATPSFQCGFEFISSWLQYFPEHQGLSQREFKDLQVFASNILNLSDCSAKEASLSDLNTYFLKTKEYKNEL